MADRLVPCPACFRHVRATESVCPFCAGALVVDERTAARGVVAVPVGGAVRAVSRTAIALASAAAIASCGKEPKPPDPPDAAVLAFPPYGQPIIPQPEPDEAAPPSTLYGAPGMDNGPRDAGRDARAKKK